MTQSTKYNLSHTFNPGDLNLNQSTFSRRTKTFQPASTEYSVINSPIDMAAPPVYDANAGPSPLTAADALPPPVYQEQLDDPEEVLQPAIFVLGDRFIHHESLSSSPMYQLSRVIHAQGKATNKIELERLDHRVKTLSDGSPSVAARGKHIYNLLHYSVLFSADFQCGIEPLSRKGIGKVAIKKSSFPHSGFRAARMPFEREKNFDKSAYLYAIKERKDVFEWLDSMGNVIATEDQRDGQHMLFIAVPLTRRRMDGLVALWCLWMWHIHIEDIPQPPRWEHCKFILCSPRPTLTERTVKTVMGRSRLENTGTNARLI